MPNTKYVQIVVDGKVVAISQIKECTPLEFIQKSKAAENNLENLIGGLLHRIAKLEEEVKVLKGEE